MENGPDYQYYGIFADVDPAEETCWIIRIVSGDASWKSEEKWEGLADRWVRSGHLHYMHSGRGNRWYREISISEVKEFQARTLERLRKERAAGLWKDHPE